jgi:hypothetical protein
MSKANKITQIINNICHRSPKDDAETSVCQKSKPKITLLQKRLLWCFIGIILLIGGYFWWRMPARMRVVAVIPGGVNYEIAKWTPLGLCRLSYSHKSDVPSIITQYGWDGKLLWSADGPLMRIWNEYNFACSPDGHVVAVSKIDNDRIHIMSWRDGNLLGQVFLSTEPDFILINNNINLIATNSGRIWIYNEHLKYFSIIAIDGNHIAKGNIKITKVNKETTLMKFSPDDNLMVAKLLKPVLQDMTLKVQGKQVVVDKTISKQYPVYFTVSDGRIELDKEGFLRCSSGEKVDSSVWLQRTLPGSNDSVIVLEPRGGYNVRNSSCRLLNIVNGKLWNIHSSKDKVIALCGTPDGKFALTFDRNDYHFYPHFIYQLPILYNFLRHHENKLQLSLYNDNGNQVAVLPLNDSIAKNGLDYTYGTCDISGNEFFITAEFAISPDGSNIGFECDAQQGNKLYVIIGR